MITKPATVRKYKYTVSPLGSSVTSQGLTDSDSHRFGFSEKGFFAQLVAIQHTRLAVIQINYLFKT